MSNSLPEQDGNQAFPGWVRLDALLTLSTEMMQREFLPLCENKVPSMNIARDWIEHGGTRTNIIFAAERQESEIHDPEELLDYTAPAPVFTLGMEVTSMLAGYPDELTEDAARRGIQLPMKHRGRPVPCTYYLEVDYGQEDFCWHEKRCYMVGKKFLEILLDAGEVDREWIDDDNDLFDIEDPVDRHMLYEAKKRLLDAFVIMKLLEDRSDIPNLTGHFPE